MLITGATALALNQLIRNFRRFTTTPGSKHPHQFALNPSLGYQGDNARQRARSPNDWAYFHSIQVVAGALMDWDNIRIFLAVARSGQMLAAANKLLIDHATVRRRLTALEDQLGAKLLDRQTTGCYLTPAGERFYSVAERAETEIIRGQSLVSELDGALTGTVRIGAPDGFGTYFLATELAGFVSKHPLLTVQLVPVPRIFSFNKREADIVISLERIPEKQIVSRKLTDYTLSVYASEEHLQQHGPILHKDDVRDRTLITYVRDLWYSPHLDYFAEVEENVSRRYECVSVLGQVEAVRSGVGIGILHDFLATRYSDLKLILPEIRFTRSYWLSTHGELRTVSHVRELVDFIVAKVKLRGNRLFNPYGAGHPNRNDLSPGA